MKRGTPGFVRALDPLTGAKRWDFPLHVGSHAAGVLSTAGGVVFAASLDGNLIALDARTGKELWHYQTGTQILSSPISFSCRWQTDGLNRNQFVADDVCIAVEVPLTREQPFTQKAASRALAPGSRLIRPEIAQGPKACIILLQCDTPAGMPAEAGINHQLTMNRSQWKGTYVEEIDSLHSTLLLMIVSRPALAIERLGVEFKIFQFPANAIPRIDGKADDWEMVPKEYTIGMDQLSDTVGGRGTKIDRKDKDVNVRVGWVKGLNRLYFLYESYDDFWDFNKTDLHNDIFELVVDGDLSGGPLIKQMHPYSKLSKEEAHFRFHGVHAQNYHIFTPSEGKDWAMVWGCQPWIKELP